MSRTVSTVGRLQGEDAQVARIGDCKVHGAVVLENVRPWDLVKGHIGECGAPGCGTTLVARPDREVAP